MRTHQGLYNIILVNCLIKGLIIIMCNNMVLWLPVDEQLLLEYKFALLVVMMRWPCIEID